jgi:hypothetical protein
MRIAIKPITLTEDDLKEIFSLFTSSTKYERAQAYDKNSEHHFVKVEPFAEYTLKQEKREYALDAWRAVIHFLHSKGYSLCKDGERLDMSFIDDDFID